MGASKTIVLIEDHAATRRLLTLVLDRVDAHLVYAATGLAGLEAIEAHEPDLVVLDLMLPDLNGWEILSWIRHRHEPAQLPVLIVTAYGGEENESRAELAGADGYLAKPFDPQELRQAVLRLLGGCPTY
ncbi:MAG: response regulator [Acidimicrobiia bacterium]|nr:response regulator [Acidimicrobiia bacterium]